MEERIGGIAVGIMLGAAYSMGALVVAMAALHSVSRVAVRVAVVPRSTRRLR